MIIGFGNWDAHSSTKSNKEGNVEQFNLTLI